MILPTIHRKKINQLAHAAAVRFEMETRDKWIRELTQALESGASFAELQARIVKLASSYSRAWRIDGHGNHTATSRHSFYFPIEAHLPELLFL